MNQHPRNDDAQWQRDEPHSPRHQIGVIAERILLSGLCYVVCQAYGILPVHAIGDLVEPEIGFLLLYSITRQATKSDLMMKKYFLLKRNIKNQE